MKADGIFAVHFLPEPDKIRRNEFLRSLWLKLLSPNFITREPNSGAPWPVRSISQARNVNDMLGLIGFLTMAIIILLLLRSKTIPAIAFVAVPTVMALIAGFSVGEIGGFVKKGVASTSSMAALFIFSITFFGIMTDAGMFDRIIDALVGRAGNNVVAITVLTAVIACIGHLDGSGASTFLITIPAMLPI